MVEEKDDANRVLKYGSGRYIFHQIPLACILLALGIATQVWPSVFPRHAQYFGGALAMASLAFIAFALFRRFLEPGKPRLVLAPDGIFQRLSHGRILHIPWHEVQGVESVTQTLANVLGLVQTIVNVPAVVVSRTFYDREMPLQPWRKRSLNWGHFAERDGDVVRVLFRPAFLGTTGRELRAAIETRWRAFGAHPEAKLPPKEESPSYADPALSFLRRWAPLALFALVSIPVVHTILTPEEMSEATRSAYLGDHLDRTGVPARLADGSMKRLRRSDIDKAGIPQCPETTRSDTWIPAYIASAACIAELILPSGERATAVFRLGTSTYTVEYKIGSFREEKAAVPVSLSLEEADTLLCRLGHCGAGMQKR